MLLAIGARGISNSIGASRALLLSFYPSEHIFHKLSYPYDGIINTVAIYLLLLLKDKRCRPDFVRVIMEHS
jgi:hypothetical protein